MTLLRFPIQGWREDEEILYAHVCFTNKANIGFLVFVVLAFFVAYPRLTTIGSHVDQPRKADRNPRGTDQRQVNERKICFNS